MAKSAAAPWVMALQVVKVCMECSVPPQQMSCQETSAGEADVATYARVQSAIIVLGGGLLDSA